MCGLLHNHRADNPLIACVNGIPKLAEKYHCDCDEDVRKVKNLLQQKKSACGQLEAFTDICRDNKIDYLEWRTIANCRE